MRELRKQALESHKKSSRKSQNKESQIASLHASAAGTPTGSRQASRLNTPAMSRVGSRVGSANGSEGDDSSEDGSVRSELYDNPADQMSPDEAATWETILKDRIQEITDWKRSSVGGREQALQQYVRILQHRYAAEEIEGQEQDLLVSFLRSIKQAASEKEVELALKALELTSMTSGLETMFEDCGPRLKRTIEEEGPSVQIKAQAIHAYATLAFCSGLTDESLIELLDFYLDIVATDGESIEAENKPEPVIAALEAYSLLASFVEDLSEDSADHVDTLIDQLDSTYPAVQVASAEAIALLYEKSWTEATSDEDISQIPQASISYGQDSKDALIRRYDASYRYNELISKLSEEASSNTKAKRKDMKAARSSFRYILSSLQNPAYGPMYSTALQAEKESNGTGRSESGRHVGSKYKIKVSGSQSMVIDKWYYYVQVKALRECLQGGFISPHYYQNPMVSSLMPSLGSGWKGR